MKNKLFKVALLQIMPAKSMNDNLNKGIEYVKKAKALGADLALFPEMWNIGYDFKRLNEAISLDDPFIKAYQNLAKELEIAIVITFLEKKDDNKLRNSLALIDQYGNMQFVYAKVHTCDFSFEKILTPGDDFYVCDLVTKKGIVKCGAMICYDREFPEAARILMLKGAEIILVPNACPMEINRLSQLRGRAYENMLGIATCNYPLGKVDCNGHSSAFDGVAYLKNLPGSRDMKIAEASEEEMIVMASFDLDMMRKYRQIEVHGNSYRHPRKYHLLVDEAINEPFIRKDYRK